MTESTNKKTDGYSNPSLVSNPFLLLTIVGRSENEHDVHRLTINQSPCILGSDPRARLTIQGSGIHPKHCEFVHGPTGTRVRGLVDELIVNGQHFEEAWIHPGDRIRLGELELLVSLCEMARQAPEAIQWSRPGPSPDPHRFTMVACSQPGRITPEGEQDADGSLTVDRAGSRSSLPLRTVTGDPAEIVAECEPTVVDPDSGVESPALPRTGEADPLIPDSPPPSGPPAEAGESPAEPGESDLPAEDCRIESPSSALPGGPSDKPGRKENPCGSEGDNHRLPETGLTGNPAPLPPEPDPAGKPVADQHSLPPRSQSLPDILERLRQSGELDSGFLQGEYGEPATAAAYGEPQVDKSSTPGVTGQADPDIADYINQLMSRLRGESTDTTGPLADALPEPEILPPVELPPLLAARDFVPRGIAPEKTDTLNAFRQIANQSFRSELKASTRQKNWRDSLIYLAGTGLSFFLAIVLLIMSDRGFNLSFILSGVCFVTCGVSGFLFAMVHMPLEKIAEMHSGWARRTRQGRTDGAGPPLLSGLIGRILGRLIEVGRNQRWPIRNSRMSEQDVKDRFDHWKKQTVASSVRTMPPTGHDTSDQPPASSRDG